MNIRKLGLSFVKNYLRVIVGLLLAVKKPEIIAVTGTAGKTTTKETIYAVLAQKFGAQVARSHGSLSTKTGLPIAMLGFTPEWSTLGPPWWHWPGWLGVAVIRMFAYLFALKSYPKLWVVEFAADLPGDFKFLLSYIKPRIGVVTNVGLGHTQFFGSPAGVAREKGLLVQVLPADGYAILNYNDDLARHMADQTKAKIAWVRARGIHFAPVAARIIGRLYGLSYQDIERGLRTVKLPAGRFDIRRGPNNMIIIDASYNANPVSMAAALQELADFPRKSIRGSRKIAILGEMLELGEHAAAAHKQVYQQARLVADHIITIGEGFKKLSEHHFKNVDEAVEPILSALQPGDIILLKGSFGVGLRKLVHELTK